MNLIQYINKYKDFSFKEVPFNEVDNIILAGLSYISLDDYIPHTKENPVTLGSVGKSFFKNNSKKIIKKNIFSIVSSYKIFNEIYTKKRYKDLLLYNYIYEGSSEGQFSALFIDLDEETTYISFEGTDELVSGWIEDAELAYIFPMLAQKKAIKYINKNIPIFSQRKYYVGGHSKGGNLALVSTMYANIFIKSKILKIYMNDAPGLREKEINSYRYKVVEDKIVNIIPDSSIIGVMLYNFAPRRIVKSNKIGPFAHDFNSWVVSDKEFKPSKLTDFSNKMDILFDDWLENYTDQEKEEFTKDLFDVLRRANINSILEIKSSIVPSIFVILKESKKMSTKSKKMIKNLINIFIKYKG